MSDDREFDTSRAGGVVLALIDDQVCVAAVSPSRHAAGAWCLPKGHLEDGEVAVGAALREVREETGLVCEVLESLGAVESSVPRDGKRVRICTDFWLMAAIGGALATTSNAEIRDVAWRPVEGAEPALTDPDEARLVAGLVARLRAEAGGF